MRNILIIIYIVFFSGVITAQEVELPQYVSHLADNPFLISPTYAGIGSGLKVRLNGLSQWIGVKGAPDTQSLTIESRLTDRFGGGLTVFNDKNGFSKQQGAKLSLASHLELSNFHNSFLSFALSYNFTQFTIDTSEDNTASGKPTKSVSNSNFDVGMLYRYERFSVSFNILNLLKKRVLNFSNDEPESLQKYVLYTSYVLAKVSAGIEIEPSILIEHREQDQRSRTDLNVKVRKGIDGGYIWAGLSYTFLNDQFFRPNAIAPLIGLKKNSFYMSYGFGITVNEIADFNFGTHMISLGFDYDRRPSLARCTQKMMIF